MNKLINKISREIGYNNIINISRYLNLVNSNISLSTLTKYLFNEYLFSKNYIWSLYAYELAITCVVSELLFIAPKLKTKRYIITIPFKYGRTYIYNKFKHINFIRYTLTSDELKNLDNTSIVVVGPKLHISFENCSDSLI